MTVTGVGHFAVAEVCFRETYEFFLGGQRSFRIAELQTNDRASASRAHKHRTVCMKKDVGKIAPPLRRLDGLLRLH